MIKKVCKISLKIKSILKIFPKIFVKKENFSHKVREKNCCPIEHNNLRAKVRNKVDALATN